MGLSYMSYFKDISGALRNSFKEFGNELYEKISQIEGFNSDFYKKIDFICILSFIYATKNNRFKGFLDMNILLDEFYKSEDFIKENGKSILEECANKLGLDNPTTIKYPRFSIQTTNDNKEPDTKKSELQNSLEDLRGKLNKLQEEYHGMFSDGVIDENKLEVLIRKINELSKDADGLLMFITKTERQILNSIIDNIQEEKMKMKKTLNNMTDIARTSI